MTKMSKICQNTSKYVFFTPKSCQKVVETPFSRVPIIFSIVASDSPSNFGSEKCIHLIFGNFRFFGHSDTVESIWKSTILSLRPSQNRIFALKIYLEELWPSCKKRKDQKCPSATFDTPFVSIGQKLIELEWFFDFSTFGRKGGLRAHLRVSKFQICKRGKGCP